MNLERKDLILKLYEFIFVLLKLKYVDRIIYDMKSVISEDTYKPVPQVVKKLAGGNIQQSVNKMLVGKTIKSKIQYNKEYNKHITPKHYKKSKTANQKQNRRNKKADANYTPTKNTKHALKLY